MHSDEIRFLIYTGLLKNQKEKDIIKNLKISNKDFANAIGFDTFENYLDIIDGTLSKIDLPDYEQMILSFYQTEIYCNVLTTNNNIITSRTLKETILKENVDNSILYSIISEMLPEIHIGKTLSMKDGILTITKDLEDLYLDKAVKVFKDYTYAASILTFNRYKKIKNYFDITQGSIIDSESISSIIKICAKSGYKISALPYLLGINIPDYIKIYNIFNVIIKVCSDNENFLLLTHDGDESVIVKLPLYYFDKLVITPSLFANSKFDKKNGKLYILTNTGYKNLI